MNIIEHVWAYLKRQISLSGEKPKTRADLSILVKRTWESIPLWYIRKLYESIPRRIDALIAAKGGFTKY